MTREDYQAVQIPFAIVIQFLDALQFIRLTNWQIIELTILDYTIIQGSVVPFLERESLIDCLLY